MPGDLAIHVVGSMMIDRVARVREIPRPGETVAATSTATFAGGKGANQAAAAARCGAKVRMLGRTGADGAFIRDALRDAGVDVRHVATDDPRSGAATVMVAEGGENAIVIAPESNRRIGAGDIDRFLAAARAGEIVLFQNECSALDEGIVLAGARGLRVWLNAAPADAGLAALRYEKLAGLIVNETEAEALSGEREPARALAVLASRMPAGTVVVTLGAQGAIARSEGREHAHRGFAVDAVDTVGCGDAFVGAFLAAIAAGQGVARALERGNAAGALAAMRAGAIASLPSRAEVDAASALSEGSRLPPRSSGECIACGQLLAGVTAGAICPECGAEVVENPFPPRWTPIAARRRFRFGAWSVTAAYACWLLVAQLIWLGEAFAPGSSALAIVNGVAIALAVAVGIGWLVGSPLLVWYWPSRGGRVAIGAAIVLKLAAAAVVPMVVAPLASVIWFQLLASMFLMAEFAGIVLVLSLPRVVRPGKGFAGAVIVLACGLPLSAAIVQQPPSAYPFNAEFLVGCMLAAGGLAGGIAYGGLALRLRRIEQRMLPR